MNDAELARTWQQSNGGTHGDACPTLDEIEALWQERLDPARREVVLQALATCADCALLVQLAGDIAQAAESTVRAVPSGVDHERVVVLRPRTARPHALRWVAGLAASLLVAVVAFALLRPLPPTDVLRGATPPLSVEPPDGTRLSQPPATLDWPSQSTDARYVVEIFDASATLLWRSALLSESRVVLDPEARAALGRGRYVWRVRLQDGSDATLGPFRFDIAP
jgi:hypothetical protein